MKRNMVTLREANTLAEKQSTQVEHLDSEDAFGFKGDVRVHMEKLLGLFRRHMRGTRSNKENSLERAMSCVQTFVRFTKRPIWLWTKEDLPAFLEHKHETIVGGASAQTQAGYITYLRILQNFLMSDLGLRNEIHQKFGVQMQEWVDATNSIVIKSKKNKRKKLTHALSDEEFTMLMEEFSAAIELAFQSNSKARYENALGSLEPWFRELGGRGVLVASARSSYYLTQYRRSLAQAANLNVDHTLAELQPWSRVASEKYLREMGVSSAIIADIKDRDWNILSVPFFAKAFAAWLARAQGTGQTLLSIYEIVVEQYLEREARKLTDPNAGPLLTADELRQLFTEVAELMQGSKNREIEQADLVACAEVVVNTSNLESARPGLTRRLSSLCGLGVSSDSGGQNQFGFSHEVLFDCFLSLAIQQRISNVLNIESLLRLLSTSTVNAAVFEWLVEKKPEAIALLAKDALFRLTNEDETRVLSANLGALWEVMLVHQNGVPATAVASGLQLERIDLASNGWRNLDLSGSVIGDIAIHDGSVGCIDVSRADITFLKTDSSEQAKRSLKGIETADVHSVHIGDRYGDSRKQVREILESLQLVQRENNEGDQEAREAAFYFLDRLARRPDATVILYREDLSADDQRLSWINHYDADHWRFFVNALTESGVASLEPLSTSGRPKVRLSFRKPIASLLSRDENSEEILKFWKEF